MHKKATTLCLADGWARYFGEQIFFFSSARSCRLVGNCSFLPAFSSVSLFIHGCSCSCKASGVGLAGWLNASCGCTPLKHLSASAEVCWSPFDALPTMQAWMVVQGTNPSTMKPLAMISEASDF